MTIEENKIQIKILLELLGKRKKLFEQIYTITENQFTIINSNESSMDFFDKMNQEKKILINRANEIDEYFLSIYNKVFLFIKNNPKPYKEIIEELQEQIRNISEIDTKIKIQEEKNKQELLASDRFNNKKTDRSFIGRKQAIESYKKSIIKKDI